MMITFLNERDISPEDYNILIDDQKKISLNLCACNFPFTNGQNLNIKDFKKIMAHFSNYLFVKLL